LRRLFKSRQVLSSNGLRIRGQTVHDLLEGPKARKVVRKVMDPEWQKMVAGELYNPHVPELVRLRERARDLCQDLNATREAEKDLRARLLGELLGAFGEGLWLQPPFYCDYGVNIRLGRNCFFNFNCIVLDVCPVTIGDHVFFGPAVQVYTPLHPFSAERRRTQEYGKPVVIGSDVWIGGAAIICPGVTIGTGTVVGAGSVVTRSLPDGVFAAGNPCRVIREITEDERTPCSNP
jgi:maltose O-acetyltransferase